MPKSKESARPKLFFDTKTKSMNEEEFQQYCSAEATGARLVNFISGVCGKAHSELPDKLKERYKLDLEKPDWLDPTYPHLAMNELHRIASQLPRYMPGKVWVQQKKGKPVRKDEFQLSEDQTFAMTILVMTKEVIEAAGRIQDPAAALLLIEASISLGHKIAEAVAVPYEPYAAAGVKTSKGLDDHNNKVSSACRKRNEIRKSRVREIIAKDPSISSNKSKISDALLEYKDESIKKDQLRKIVKNILDEIG